jgi:hypothetical protein
MKTESFYAKAFYREVVSVGNVWTIQLGKGGGPTFDDKKGKSRFYVWSSRDRVMRMIENEYVFQGCRPVEVPWVLFSTKWLPGLAELGFVFILNWAGRDEPIWEESAEEIAMNMEHHIELHQIESHQNMIME